MIMKIRTTASRIPGLLTSRFTLATQEGFMFTAAAIKEKTPKSAAYGKKNC